MTPDELWNTIDNFFFYSLVCISSYWKYRTNARIFDFYFEFLFLSFDVNCFCIKVFTFFKNSGSIFMFWCHCRSTYNLQLRIDIWIIFKQSLWCCYFETLNNVYCDKMFFARRLSDIDFIGPKPYLRFPTSSIKNKIM